MKSSFLCIFAFLLMSSLVASDPIPRHLLKDRSRHDIGKLSLLRNEPDVNSGTKGSRKYYNKLDDLEDYQEESSSLDKKLAKIWMSYNLDEPQESRDSILKVINDKLEEKTKQMDREESSEMDITHGFQTVQYHVAVPSASQFDLELSKVQPDILEKTPSELNIPRNWMTYNFNELQTLKEIIQKVIDDKLEEKTKRVDRKESSKTDITHGFETVQYHVAGHVPWASQFDLELSKMQPKIWMTYNINDLQALKEKIQKVIDDKLEEKLNFKTKTVQGTTRGLETQRTTVRRDFDLELSKQKGANDLSALTRYVGVGYNLLKGNPEGDFNLGGLDPGILTTKHIFQFTYNQGKQTYYGSSVQTVPDQVVFEKLSSMRCPLTTRLSAYSGPKSYQKQLSANVEAEAWPSYSRYMFGLSAGMQSARAATEDQQRVNIDKQEICAYGRVRYQLENQNEPEVKVTKVFYNAIKRLPFQRLSDTVYFRFLNKWGTHILVEADVGTRKIDRSYLSYAETYKYLRNIKNNVGIIGGGFYEGSSVDISAMNQQLDSSSLCQGRVTSISMGTRDEPLPVHIVLKPITEALAPEYWRNLPNGDTYQSLRVAEKKRYIEKALQEYPTYLQLNQVKDPEILIPNAWPDGTYAMHSTTSGCPSGWSEGWRIHDTEDHNNNNHWSPNVPNHICGYFQDDKIQQYFCVKGEATANYGLEWPKGSYCIAKKGHCPTNFRSGLISWDDEDDNNVNEKLGVLPDGEYGSNTKIQYCCRNDQRPEIPITLPRDQPFILYRYGGTCQKVAGMAVEDEFIRFDDEDTKDTDLFGVVQKKNGDFCLGAHPDDDANCINDHKIHFCYYTVSTELED